MDENNTVKENSTAGHTRSIWKPLNNKLCCQSCKMNDIESVDKLRNHVENLPTRHHVVGCVVCKIRFPIRPNFPPTSSLNQLSLHVLTKGHISNIASPDVPWPLAASESRPSCEVCWKSLRFSGDSDAHAT